MRTYLGINDDQRLTYLESFLVSNLTQSQFEKENGLQRNSIYRWLRTFAVEDKNSTLKITSQMSRSHQQEFLESPEDELLRLKQELQSKELELKRATMARDAYAKMIEIAEEKYGIPIRKNSDAK